MFRLPYTVTLFLVLAVFSSGYSLFWLFQFLAIPCSGCLHFKKNAGILLADPLAEDFEKVGRRS
jgi:hypothetical protein